MMAESIERLQHTITSELSVLEDDIHIPDDKQSLTFYLPTEDLDTAKDTLDADLEVLEDHEYEYLIKATF